MKKNLFIGLLVLNSIIVVNGPASACVGGDCLSVEGETSGYIPGSGTAQNDLLGFDGDIQVTLAGMYGANIDFTGVTEVTFQYLGKEAGYNNEFEVSTSSGYLDDSYTSLFNTGDSSTDGSTWGAEKKLTVDSGLINFRFLADTDGVKGIATNGSNPDNNGDAPNFFVSDLRNREFTLGTTSALISALNTDTLGGGIYLWFDDGGAGNDDNHDDMLIKITATCSPVPIPGSALLLGSGLLGLLGIGTRRNKA